MKSFRTFLVESLNDNLKELESVLTKSYKISKKDSKGFYIAVDCDKDEDGYYVTDRQEIELRKFIIRFNDTHNFKIDWNHPNSNLKEVYIFIK